MSKDSGVVNAVIVVAALGVLIYAAWCYNSSRQTEKYQSYAPAGDIAMPSDPASEQYKPVDYKTVVNAAPEDCFPRDRLSADDLLPKDAANSKWAQVNPAGQGDVKDQNFLTAGYHLGFDTQGTSLRNASYDLRSSPTNPRYRVSIWQNSTIDPDLARRPLE